MLGHVVLYWLKFENSQIFRATFFGYCMALQSLSHVRATMLRLGMRISSIFNSQHAATRRNRVTKRMQHVAPNNVAICCIYMLRSFGRGLQMLGQQAWDMRRIYEIIHI